MLSAADAGSSPPSWRHPHAASGPYRGPSPCRRCRWDPDSLFLSLSLSLPLGSERPSKFPSLRIVWAPVSFLFYNNSLVENAFLVENITCWRWTIIQTELFEHEKVIFLTARNKYHLLIQKYAWSGHMLWYLYLWSYLFLHRTLLVLMYAFH